MTISSRSPTVPKIREINGDGVADKFIAATDNRGIRGESHAHAFASNFDAEDRQWLVLFTTGLFGSEVP
ncbi:MAG TPA: hypothetical protein DDZ51_15830 [Planctomycetaceae bacterium]|nr:hypothetical protein [Planctomycetaceae bacterium]